MSADRSMYVAGTGGSTESGLEQGLERESYDSDQELEAIRGSVRSLRAQRAAVEKLKEKARLQEGTAEELRRKLREAEERVCELRAQGGRDVVRRLMDEVTYTCHVLLLFLSCRALFGIYRNETNYFSLNLGQTRDKFYAARSLAPQELVF